MKRKQITVARIRKRMRTKRNKQSVRHYVLQGRRKGCSVISKAVLHSEGVMIMLLVAIVMLISWSKPTVANANRIFSVSYSSFFHESIDQFITVLQ